MCSSKKVGKFYQNWGDSMGLDSLWRSVKTNYGNAHLSGNTVDRWFRDSVKINDPAELWLPGVADKTGAQVTGSARREAQREEDRQAGRDLALKPNPAPLPPSRTAPLINPATELADRRKRRLIEARWNVTQPGPGANIPMG